MKLLNQYEDVMKQNTTPNTTTITNTKQNIEIETVEKEQTSTTNTVEETKTASEIVDEEATTTDQQIQHLYFCVHHYPPPNHRLSVIRLSILI